MVGQQYDSSPAQSAGNSSIELPVDERHLARLENLQERFVGYCMNTCPTYMTCRKDAEVSCEVIERFAVKAAEELDELAEARRLSRTAEVNLVKRLGTSPSRN